MTARRLLCTDLDRTLAPNGAQPEDPDARPRLWRTLQQHGIALAYVTGRHLALVEALMAEYDLARPDYLIGDVGTRIYSATADGWTPWPAWGEELGRDWFGLDSADIARLLHDIEGLERQEPERQAPHKLSYYVREPALAPTILADVQNAIDRQRLHSNLVWSIDETRQLGLLDILPQRASKLDAIRYLMQAEQIAATDTLFAGDSGNDLSVLASEIPAVLVANATADVRAEALRLAEAAGHRDRLYLASGRLTGLNGHYAAGILEGLYHAFPELRSP